MIQLKPAIFAAILMATAAMAHDGVQNPAVKARMDAMAIIGQNMKVLAGMAKGQTAFAAPDANAALSAIAEQAARVPALFEAQEDDPKSEAAPEIWVTWDDFVSKAGALQSTATANTGLTDANGLGAAMAAVGGTCKACHESYKF